METKSSRIQSYKTVTKARLVKEPTTYPTFPITTSKDAYEFARELYDGDIEIFESFFCLFVNRSNKLISFAKISQGGVAGTVVDPKIVFKFCFDLMASGIIMVHNHPSGATIPSEQDISLTKKIKQIAEFHEVKILDHLIVTPTNYYSFADNGMI
jgi:DNA repair protein RadC